MSTRTWSSRARSRTPSRAVLKKADRAPGTTRSPSEGRRVSFSDIPETKYFDLQPKKRATSRAREVISDAKKAQKSTTKYFHRPEKMTCLICAQADALFFCRACGHGSCLDCYHEADNHCSCNRIYLVSMSAKRSPPRSILEFPSRLNLRAGPRLTDMPVDFAVCKKSRTLFLAAVQQDMPQWIALFSKELASTIFRIIQPIRADPFPQLLNTGTNNQM